MNGNAVIAGRTRAAARGRLWSMSSLVLLVGAGLASAADGNGEAWVPPVDKAAQVRSATLPDLASAWKDPAPVDAPQSRDGQDDEFEPNNSSSDASPIEAGQHELEGWDQDWFTFEVPVEGQITVSIEGAQGDLDLYLFDPSNELLAKSTEIGSSEQVSVTGVSGTYLVAVGPYEGQGGGYTLTLTIPAAPDDDELEPNDTASEARRIEAGQYELACWDRDWFAVEMSREGEITVSIEGPEGDLDLYVFDPSNELLAKSTEIGSSEQVSATGASGRHLIAVVPHEGQGSSYVLTLTINLVPEPEEPEQPDPPQQPEQPEPPAQPEQPEPAQPPQPAGPPTYRALLVGVNIYDSDYGASSLAGCVNDVNAVRAKLLVGDHWQSDNIQILTNSRATRSAVRGALHTLASESGPNDTIVYYQSSHGGQRSGTDTFLCTHDASYTDEELGEDLARFSGGQRVIVMVDACCSGGLFKAADGWPFAQQAMEACHAKKADDLLARGEAVPKDLGSNIAFMVACNYDQSCIEQAGQGLYTLCLTKACSLLPVDANRDGEFQFWELHSHAAAKASEENPNQTAQHYNRALLESTTLRGTQGASEPATPGADDAFEPNNSPWDAKVLEGGEYELACWDKDWFDFEMPADGKITITVESSQGDLDLILFGPDGELVESSMTDGTSNEQVSATGVAGRYSIVVKPYDENGASYKLTVDIPARVEAPTVAGPVPVGCGAGAVQAMVVGICGLLGVAGSSRRRTNH